MGAGTQVLTIAPYLIFIGETKIFERALLMGLGWLINIIIAEIIIYKLNPKTIFHLGLKSLKQKHE